MALRNDPQAQSVIGNAFKEFFSQLGQEFLTVSQFIAAMFVTLNVDQENIEAIKDDFFELKGNIETEIQKLKDFQIDPKWKQRVINVPIAVTQVHDFIDEITKQLLHRAEEIITPLKDLALQWKTEATVQQTQLDKPNALARGASALKDVETAIHLVRASMDAAKDVSELFIDITNKIQTLAPLFLQQGNPRKRITGTISARTGKLHRT